MKTLYSILTIFFICSILNVNANGSGADTTQYYYCEILVMSKTLSLQIEAAVIFSTDSPFWKDPVYADVIGKDNKFRTYNYALDVLNIMASKGWRYKDHYISAQGGKAVERFLLEKPR
jgi:hypothetical protein